ncbi:MAG: glycosyltransferase family A protein [Candidatus Magasanikbacteria bacterium]|nr:glycosyltransferase family A protein [Candidatus Magasanikbacteria bacterium]
MKFAPIVLFTYNRPWHTKQTVESLKRNDLAKDSELYIFSDAPRSSSDVHKVEEVRGYLDAIDGFKSISIVKRDSNFGLAKSIVSGVTQIVSEFEKVIVLEDDIVSSPYFLQYMNDALNMYENDEQVMHISGHFFPVDTDSLPDTFFYGQASCWGWATWKRAWQHYNNDALHLCREIEGSGERWKFNIDGGMSFFSTLKANAKGQINTWAVKWQASIFLENGLCLHPKMSFTRNIGLDSSGVHCSNTKVFDVNVTSHDLKLSRINLEESVKAREIMKNFYKSIEPSFATKLVNKIQMIIGK